MNALDALAGTLREARTVRVCGSGSRSDFLPEWTGPTLTVPSGIIAHDVADQVVEVWAGTPVEELQAALSEHGQCLPLAHGLPRAVSQNHGTIGGLLAMNLPHALSAQCGGPRDWTLGMTIVRTDGSVAKCGSKAVKNVAGYDAHRLMVGSRGTLAAIAKVYLRTFPLKALPAHEVTVSKEGEPNFIARTLRSEFDHTGESTKGLVAADPASCTIWSLEAPPVGSEGWAIGPSGLIVRPEQPIKFEERAGRIFDPTKKLAPGWQS